jgi:hypothetical protein
MNPNLSPMFTWEDIAERHPQYADDDGVHWGSRILGHAHEDDPEAEGSMDEPKYSLERVPISRINRNEHPPDDHRVYRAIEGYKSGADIPPPVLVKRGGVYEVSDGHHRVAARHYLGHSHIKAYVYHSPRTDKLVLPEY